MRVQPHADMAALRVRDHLGLTFGVERQEVGRGAFGLDVGHERGQEVVACAGAIRPADARLG